MKQKRSFFTSFLIGFVILVGLDQWTKGLAVKHLMHQPPFVIWDGVFELLYSENRGAAFGMMQGGKWFFLAITGIACAAMLYFLIKERKRLHFMMTFSIALLLSGAIGNLIDRVALGYVRDMIYVALIDFAVFNVADMAVTVGCCLLVLDLLFFKGKRYMEMMDKKPQTGENS